MLNVIKPAQVQEILASSVTSGTTIGVCQKDFVTGRGNKDLYSGRYHAQSVHRSC